MVNCATCGQPTLNKTTCSKRCASIYMAQKGREARAVRRYVVKCETCGKEFSRGKKIAKYCSRECFSKGKQLRPVISCCEQCGIDIVNLRYKLDGSRDMRVHRFCSPSCKMTYVAKHRTQPIRTLEWRKRMSAAQQGEKAHNWKGGRTPESKALRRTLEQREWRIAVFERDDYTCQICGKRGGKLNADHIKPYAKYPELRTVLSNGRTLCVACHKITPSYGRNLDFQD